MRRRRRTAVFFPIMYFGVADFMDSYLQNLFAERIGGKLYGKGTEIYKFEKIKRAKRGAPAANPGAELIDMGVGEPDEMAMPQCVDALAKAAAKPQNRTYADNGGPIFKEAAGRWMNKVFGIAGIDPATQIVHSHRVQGGAVDPCRHASSIPAMWP